MTEHIMTRDAIGISIRAFEHATRLGHPYLGGEHYLLALAAAAQPAGAVLRSRGVTPGGSRWRSSAFPEPGVRRPGPGRADHGRDRRRCRARRDRGVLRPGGTRAAARDVHQGPGRFSPRRRSGATRGDGVFLPHGPGVNQALVGARREAAARHAVQADVEHLALGILAVSEGLVPSILSRLGTSGPALSAVIGDRYPPAS